MINLIKSQSYRLSFLNRHFAQKMEFSTTEPTRADLVQMRRDYNEISLDES